MRYPSRLLPDNDCHCLANGVLHAQVPILAQVLRLAACLGKDNMRLLLRLGDDLLALRLTVTLTGLDGLALEVGGLRVGRCQGLISGFASGGDPAGYFRFGLPNLIQGRAFSCHHC